MVWDYLKPKDRFGEKQVDSYWRVANEEDLTRVLGLAWNSLTKYLGLPLGAPFKSTQVWDVVEERYNKWLAMWKKSTHQKKEDRLW